MSSAGLPFEEADDPFLTEDDRGEDEEETSGERRIFSTRDFLFT